MFKEIIQRETVEIENLLELNKKELVINFPKILKLYLTSIEYKVGEIIDSCNRERMLDKRYSLQKQENDLLFELNRHKELIINYVYNKLPSIKEVNTKFSIKTAHAAGAGDHIKATELVISKMYIEFSQPNISPYDEKLYQKYDYKFEIEFSYYIDIETEKGWY